MDQNGNGTLNLERTCFVWEVEEQNEFFKCLEEVILRKYSQDKMIWKYNPRGAFSGSSFGLECEKLLANGEFKGRYIYGGVLLRLKWRIFAG